MGHIETEATQVGRQVLVVDDDDEMRAVLEFVLAAEGLEAICVRTGDEALGLLRRGLRPSLILLDLTMRGLSSAEFKAALDGDSALAAIPLVILSGDPNGASIARALGAVSFLQKPAELDELLSVVARYA